MLSSVRVLTYTLRVSHVAPSVLEDVEKDSPRRLFRSPRKVGNPPPSPLIVNKKSADQNSPSVFGFNAPVTTTYQTWSTSITTSTANSVTRHLELPEEPLLNGDKLINSSSSNDSHFIPNGVVHYNTPINGSSKLASPEPMINGTKRSPSPAIPTKSLYTHEQISPPSNRPPHLRLS